MCSESHQVYQARVYMNWSRNATRNILPTTTITREQTRPRLYSANCVLVRRLRMLYVLVSVYLSVSLCAGPLTKVCINYRFRRVGLEMRNNWLGFGMFCIWIQEFFIFCLFFNVWNIVFLFSGIAIVSMKITYV